MIHYIVCDDNVTIRNNVEQIISKVMMKNKLTYQTHIFSDYDSEFMELLETELPNKIYILDIEAPSASGIDIARKIRTNDIDSILIFLTAHNELGNVLLQDELMFLTFICKFNNQEHRLESAIKNALKMIGIKQAIRFEDNGSLYTIPLDDILYITHDSVERKSIIVTNYTEYKVNKTLIELNKMLDSRFQQTHRACITNMNRVHSIDKKKGIIYFDNDTSVPMISKSFKKGLKI